MSDAIKTLASTGIDQAIDLVDKSSEGALGALSVARGAVGDVAEKGVGAMNEHSALLEKEIQDLRAKLVDRLRAFKDEVLKPLEVLP